MDPPVPSTCTNLQFCGLNHASAGSSSGVRKADFQCLRERQGIRHTGSIHQKYPAFHFSWSFAFNFQRLPFGTKVSLLKQKVESILLLHTTNAPYIFYSCSPVKYGRIDLEIYGVSRANTQPPGSVYGTVCY